MKSLFNIFKLLTKKQKRVSFLIFLVMIISAFLEVAGIGLIIPTIYFMVEPGSIEEYTTLLSKIQSFFPFADSMKSKIYSNNEVVVIILILLISLLFFIKNIVLVFLLWVQQQYVANLSYQWQNILYHGYLRNSYKFFFNRSASDLFHNINQSSVLSTGINSILSIVTEFVLIIGIIILLIYFKPFETLLIFSLFLISAVFLYNLIKKKIEEVGKKSHFFEGQRQQLALESFGGIREIKLNNKESMFSIIFNKFNKLALKMGVYKNLLSSIPRFWLETTFLIGLNIIIITIFYTSNSTINSLPTIAIFGAAAFRLMPSIGRLMVQVNILKSNLPVSKIIKNEIENLENLKEENDVDLTFNESIKMKNIMFSYNEKNKNVLEGVDIEISKSSIVGITGGSGSGKSTLLDLLIGLIIPNKGEIFLDNKPIKNNIRSWQRKIGYVSQDIFLINDTFLKNIGYEMEESKIDNVKVKKLVNILNLDKFIDNLPGQINSKVGERGIKMSGGQLKRIGIARALYRMPDVLILDETLSSLDLETEKKIMSEIKFFDKDLTIIIVSHRPSTLKLCEKVYEVDSGNIRLVNNEK